MLVVLFSMFSVITDQTRMDFVINLTSEKQENVKGGEIQYTFYSLSLNDHHEMILGNSQPGNIFMTILKNIGHPGRLYANFGLNFIIFGAMTFYASKLGGWKDAWKRVMKYKKFVK